MAATTAARRFGQTAQKIRPRRPLARILAGLRRKGRRVVFTNGCFDVLHVGHAMVLERARRLGDVLVVGLNSDESVRQLKGPMRPIIREQDRARLLAALACVDYVTIFDEPTPREAIAALRPDVLVKGADWAVRDIAGADLVQQWGGRVTRVPLVAGRSTTSLIQRILQVHRSASGR